MSAVDRKSRSIGSACSSMLRKGWFTESLDLRPGEAYAVEVEKVLHHERSKYQDILVFKSKVYGKVLVLDGVVRSTEKDECAVNELMAHVPLFSHPHPQSVLCVGGGDGGLVREVSKHPSVRVVHVCEIDERVMEVCKENLPSLSTGFDNKKVKVHVGDAADFIDKHKNSFDVLITDCCDPTAPGLKGSLRAGGIICSQVEHPRHNVSQITELLEGCRSLYPTVSYATGSSVGITQQGLMLTSLDRKTNFSEPLRKISDAEAERMGLNYYDSNVHRGCFIWPRCIKKELSKAVTLK